MKFIWSIIIVFFYCCNYSVAQLAPQTLYNTSNGLINNRTGAIAQDAAGYIWIGTDDGICCYDGRKFNFFSGSNQHFYFAQCYANRYKDYVLFGTEGEGFALCKRNKVVFKTFKNSRKTHIGSVLGIDDSTFLLATEQKNGLLLYKNGFIKPIQLPDYFTKITENYLILKRDTKNNIWLGTDKGMIVFPSGNLNNPIVLSQVFGKYINDFGENAKGDICICSGNQLICFLNDSIQNIQSNTHFKILIQDPDPIWFSTIEFDRDNNIYLGYSYNKNSSLIILKADGEKQQLKLINNNYPWGLFMDRENNLWLACENGVVKIIQPWVKNYLAEGSNFPNAKSGIILKDGSFLGNLGNVVYHINDQKTSILSCNKEIITGYLEDRFFQTMDGKIWMSNYYQIKNFNCYTSSLALKNNEFTFSENAHYRQQNLSFDMSCATSDSLGFSYFINEDGSFWIYTQNQFKPVKTKNGLKPINNFQALTATSTHGLWATNYDYGLVHFKITKINGEYIADTIETVSSDNYRYWGRNRIFIRENNELWVSTSGKKGILIFRARETGRYQLSDSIPAQNFSSYLLRNIAEDNKGNLYVCSNQGIDKIIPTSSKGGYKVQKGVFNTYLTGSFVYYIRIHNQILYAGTTGSIAQINLDKINYSKLPPQVYITQLRVNNTDQDSLLDNGQMVHFESNQNTIHFTFLSPSFMNEKEVKYKYFLAGVDEAWTKTDYTYAATYSQLKPGAYTFYVMAQNAEGIWSKEAAKFSFVIKAPFYRQWWFLLLMAVLFILFLYWLYRIQIAKAVAVERTRQRISKDLHDDVGSTLSSITLMNTLLKKRIKTNPEDASKLAEKVEETSRDMIRNISDIVWSTNPENDRIESLQFRLQQFAGDIFEPKDIAYKIYFQKELLKKELSMNLKHDLYLICKEIMNNAAKYSGAKYFNLQLSIEKNTLIIEAEDDGIGIDLNQYKKGNGLVNIRQRTQTLKGIADLNARPNEGTKWNIRIPI